MAVGQQATEEFPSLNNLNHTREDFFFRKKLTSSSGTANYQPSLGNSPENQLLNISKTCHPRCFLTWRPGALESRQTVVF